MQKWTFNGTAWTLTYTLRNGLQLGIPYTVSGYPSGNNPATGLPWSPATDSLRNITGIANGDGTATIYAITSTVSGNGDQGTDPKKLVMISGGRRQSSPPADDPRGGKTESASLAGAAGTSGPNSQHRTSRTTHDRLRNAAEQETRQSGTSMRRDHNEVGANFISDRQDGLWNERSERALAVDLMFDSCQLGVGQPLKLPAGRRIDMRVGALNDFRSSRNHGGDVQEVHGRVQA